MKGPTTGPDDRLFAFGSFLADPVSGTLFRNRAAVPLTLKSLEVLLVLVERRGQVVEKDALLKAVWPDTIVEENNLARHISTLRKVLNDHPHDHQFIVTIPGRGYRFAAPVEEVTRAEVFGPPPPPPIAAARSADPSGDGLPAAVVEPARRTHVASLMLGGLAMAAVTGMVVFAPFARSEPDAPEHKLWQLTSSGGLESDASWAPGGHVIAYSSDRDGNFDVWAQPIGETEPVRLTASPDHDWQPSWSPDGRMIAFRSERDGGGLFVVPATGGAEQRITNFGYRPRWSPTEPKILFYSSNTVRSKLYVVAGDGQNLQRVLQGFLDDFAFYQATWHPDGRRISVYGGHQRDGLSFWTVSPTGAGPIRSAVRADIARRIRNIGIELSQFTWSPAGDALYFEGRSEDAVNIWRVRVDPRSLEWTDGPERLTMGGGLDTNIAVSPDGRKLAFTVRSERTRLWSFPFDPIAGRVLGSGQAVSARGVDALYPDLPADGSQVVYRTVRRGRHELHARSLADGVDRLLAATDEMRVPRWSDDGSQLAFRRIRRIDPEGERTENAIVLMSADGNRERLLTAPGAREITPYDWSSDGEWILGSCEHGSEGRIGVCLLPVSGAPRAQDRMRVIASDPERNLYQATFSPDQRWIAFNATVPSAGLSTIYAVGADGGQWTPITEGQFWDDKPRWSPDGRTLYFVSNRSGFLNVWGRRFDPETGRPAGDPFRVTTFENPSERVSVPVNTMELAISPNQMILPIVEASGAIWVLENVDR